MWQDIDLAINIFFILWLGLVIVKQIWKKKRQEPRIEGK